MHSLRPALIAATGVAFIMTSCSKQEESKPQAQAETAPATPAPVVAEEKVEASKSEEPVPAEALAPPQAPSEYAVTSPDQGLGDFGSIDPVERVDMPTRGVIPVVIDQEKNFMTQAHWEQYNLAFKAKRWGRYAVRLTYLHKAAPLGVQLKYGEERLKTRLANTKGAESHAMIGEIYVPAAGDHTFTLYTPPSMGYIHFYPKHIELVPVGEGEEVKQSDDGSVALLAKDATTWSENMRYEPKPEKNCLGFWTDPQDFAEWEFTVDKPGKFAVAVHQGCGGGGGSEVAVSLEGQELKFKVQDTGGFQKWTEVKLGELKIDKPGTYYLKVQPQTKQGNAVMDIQKVVLAPVS